MFALPDQLYQLTERDIGQTWGRSYKDTSQASVAAVNVTTDIIIPRDRCSIITAAFAQIVPGAGQSLTRLSFRLIGNGVADSLLAGAAHLGLAAAEEFWWDRQGWWFVPPGWNFRCSAVFSAGGVANLNAVWISGFQIPIGTLQF